MLWAKFRRGESPVGEVSPFLPGGIPHLFGQGHEFLQGPGAIQTPTTGSLGVRAFSSSMSHAGQIADKFPYQHFNLKVSTMISRADWWVFERNIWVRPEPSSCTNALPEAENLLASGSLP